MLPDFFFLKRWKNAPSKGTEHTFVMFTRKCIPSQVYLVWFPFGRSLSIIAAKEMLIELMKCRGIPKIKNGVQELYTKKNQAIMILVSGSSSRSDNLGIDISACIISLLLLSPF